MVLFFKVHASYSVNSYNAINHLASADHLKNLKHFLWKYGGGMDHLDSFRILEPDVAKVLCCSIYNQRLLNILDFHGISDSYHSIIWWLR